MPPATPRVPTLAAGDLLAGRFEILGCRGSGSMGEVYEAFDRELGERLALKVLAPAIARDEEVLQRFKREIQLARKVTHPNVCRLYDLFYHRRPAGDPGGDLAFYAMELLDGEPLLERLGRGPLPAEEALPLVGQIAEALAAAHAAGVIHRDFKSGNVLLVSSPQGTRAVVTDFGLAWSGSSTRLTDTGDLVGSPAYMAPEQLRGQEVTPATDVYALGVVIYEMVAGALPFAGETPFLGALKRLREPPTPLRHHRPDLDPRWEAVLLRCLARAPGERFGSPLEVAQALRGEIPALPPPAPEPVPRARAGGATAAAALLLAGSAVLLAGSIPEPAGRLAGRGGKVPRPAVAVLGFADLSGRPEAGSIAGSLAQMLPAELAAGERLRLISGEQVERMRRDLDLPVARSFAPDTLARIRAHTGADFVVAGSCLAAGGEVRCDAQVQDTRRGEAVAALTERATEAALLDLVAAMGRRLRASLGAGEVSPVDLRSARASRPADPRAARLYAEGLARLARFEAQQARELLERACAADPKGALPRAALAAAWSALGYDDRAAERAEEAFALASGLRHEDRRLVEARFREASGQWPRAAEVYRELWAYFPDNLEYGLRLASVVTRGGDGARALSIVEEMQRLPPPLGEDPRIDLAEAEASLGTDFERQRQAAARAAVKGQALGSRLLVARARYYEGLALAALGRLREAEAAGEEASRIFAQAGDLVSSAMALNSFGSLLVQQGELARAREAFARVLVLGRESGNQRVLASGLIALGSVARSQGDLAAARGSYEQALAAFRRTGSRSGEAAALTNLANLMLPLGERTAAWRLYGEALEAFDRLGQKGHAATVLLNMAGLSLDGGDLQAAEDLFARSLAAFRELGDASGAAESEAGVGRVLGIRGELAPARGRLRSAIDRSMELGERIATVDYLLDLARLEVEAGRPGEGEALARRAVAQMRTGEVPEQDVAAGVVLAAAALAQGRTAAAAAALERIAAPLAGCEDRGLRLHAAIVGARVHAAAQAGGARAAERALAAAAEEARRAGFPGLELEARLALGKVEAAAGEARGGERLREVARQARARRYGLIGRRAAGVEGF